MGVGDGQGNVAGAGEMVGVGVGGIVCVGTGAGATVGAGADGVLKSKYQYITMKREDMLKMYSQRHGGWIHCIKPSFFT